MKAGRSGQSPADGASLTTLLRRVPLSQQGEERKYGVTQGSAKASGRRLPVGGGVQAGRRALSAWAIVPSSSQSRSPPTGTPLASMVTGTLVATSRSAR